MFYNLLIGFVIGAYGALRNWGYFRTVLVALAINLLVQLFMSPAHADAVKAFSSLKASTVHIAIGSGSIVEGPSGQHYLLTNWHVCNAGQWLGKMRANYEDGTLVEGRVAKKDALVDLCVTRVKKDLVAIKVGSALALRQQIYTRGYPYGVLSQTTGQYLGRQSWGYTFGIEEVGECPKGSKPVKSGEGNLRGCTIVYNDNLTNMYSRPGSSGSPVVDDNGELVGVISSWYGDSDSGGMVRLEDIQDFLRGL